MTGQTLNLSSSDVYYINYNILRINKNNGDELLTISQNGDIHYNYNNEMVKVNCPEDIIDAFLHTVLNFTDSNLENILFEKYIKKISNGNISNDNVLKLEREFRKIKVKKLNDNNK